MFMGVKPALAQGAQAERIMALGQPAAIVVHHQAAMVPGGRLDAQRAKEQNLPRGRFQQVGAAHDFRDAHGRIVGHAGQLIAGNVVAPPDDKVAEVHAGHKALRTQVEVDELNRLAVGNAETPVESAGILKFARPWDREAAACRP